MYARDCEDTGGMGDQLIPTSEMLPKHLHITKCSDTIQLENTLEILSAQSNECCYSDRNGLMCDHREDIGSSPICLSKVVEEVSPENISFHVC